MSIIDLHTPTKTHTRVKIVRSAVHAQPTNAIPAHHKSIFHKISQIITTQAGSPVAFMVAILAVVLWGISGPFFNFSDTWQLAINTGTTIITFLMVFAIQNSQNRDSKEVQLKLNELIRSGRGASDEFVDLEELDDIELEELHAQFKELHEHFERRQLASKDSSSAAPEAPTH